MNKVRRGSPQEYEIRDKAGFLIGIVQLKYIAGNEVTHGGETYTQSDTYKIEVYNTPRLQVGRIEQGEVNTLKWNHNLLEEA